MNIKIVENGLLLEPETKFEQDTLCKILPMGVTHKAFIKTGLSGDEIIGLKIERVEGEKTR